MLIENVDYFVRVVQFPNGANRGAVIPNDDGTFDVYLNAMYTDLRDGYDHEVQHLLQDHFYAETKPIQQIEREADKAPSVPPTAADDGMKHIPLYNSLEAFTAAMLAVHGDLMRSQPKLNAS